MATIRQGVYVGKDWQKPPIFGGALLLRAILCSCLSTVLMPELTTTLHTVAWLRPAGAAQAQGQPANEGTLAGNGTAAGNRNRCPVKSDSHLLESAVQLDSVPEYPGQRKFVTGRTANGDSRLTVLEFKVREDIGRVKVWYEQALNQYGWHMRPAISSYGDAAILGSTKNAEVSISLSTAATEKSFPTRVMIVVSPRN